MGEPGKQDTVEDEGASRSTPGTLRFLGVFLPSIPEKNAAVPLR